MFVKIAFLCSNNHKKQRTLYVVFVFQAKIGTQCFGEKLQDYDVYSVPLYPAVKQKQ